MRDWTAGEVLDHLKRGLPIRDARVADHVDLRDLCEPDGMRARVPVTFSGCELRALSGAIIEFEGPVVLKRTVVSAAVFCGAYFLGGLRVEGCRFESDVDFGAGGHNRDGSELALTDTVFGGFVDFYDCWFEGPVLIRRCAFEKGTNLLGNVGEPIEVSFDVPPVIEETTGDLALSGRLTGGGSLG